MLFVPFRLEFRVIGGLQADLCLTGRHWRCGTRGNIRFDRLHRLQRHALGLLPLLITPEDG